MNIPRDTPSTGKTRASWHDIPSGAIRSVAASTTRMALISAGGLIATLSDGLASDLGFDAPGDLRGLSITSLWHHDDRSSVVRAFDQAREGQPTTVTVDLAYLAGTPVPVHVNFEPGDVPDAVIMHLDWRDTEYSAPPA